MVMEVSNSNNNKPKSPTDNKEEVKQQFLPIFSSLLSQRPDLFIAGATATQTTNHQQPTLPSFLDMPPSQVLNIYTIPTSDGIRMVFQNATMPSALTIPPVVLKTERESSAPTSVPPKKRRHHYEGDGSISPPLDDGAARNSVNSNNSHVITWTSTSTSSGSDDDEDELSHKEPRQASTSTMTTSTKRPYLHQPKLSEEAMKTMTPDEIKRERNRLAADRCRKKKLAKIDQLTSEVNQMERQRRQIMFQLDSLRHAALAARDAIHSHKIAGCSISDENGAILRLIAETESLDSFVKSQFS